MEKRECSCTVGENINCYSHYGIQYAAAAAKSLQSCLTLCNSIDGSPSGSPMPGILQARTLEWVAISFSNAWKWKVKVKSLSHIQLLATPWTLWPWDFQARVLEWNTVWRILKKLGIKPPYDPEIPLLDIYPEETKIERDTCIPLSIAALFTIARTWKQPRCQ